MKKKVVSVAALVAAVASAGTAAASAQPPFATPAQVEQLILASPFAASEAVSDVSCVGLKQPKPKRNAAHQWTYHRFRCTLSGSYFTNLRAIVVLTGNGFELNPNS